MAGSETMALMPALRQVLSVSGDTKPATVNPHSLILSITARSFTTEFHGMTGKIWLVSAAMAHKSANGKAARHNISSIFFRFMVIEKLEPVVGFEPTTDGLQNRCSTTELSWPEGIPRISQTQTSEQALPQRAPNRSAEHLLGTFMLQNHLTNVQLDISNAIGVF